LDKIIEELEDEVTVTPEMKLKNAELEAEREKTKALLKQVKQLEKDKKKLEGKSEKKSKKKEPKAEKKGGFLSKKSSKKTTDKFLSIGWEEEDLYTAHILLDCGLTSRESQDVFK